jgi:hypothetical protein
VRKTSVRRLGRQICNDISSDATLAVIVTADSLFKPSICHEIPALVARSITPRVLNLVSNGFPSSVEMHAGNDHSMCHGGFADTETVGLGEAESDVECSLLITEFNKMSRNISEGRMTYLIVVDIGIHDTSYPLGELANVATKEDRLSCLDHLDNSILQVLNLCVHV